MHTTIKTLIESLKNLEQEIYSYGDSEKTFTTQYGHEYPPICPQDFIYIINQYIQGLNENDATTLNDSTNDSVLKLIERIKEYIGNVNNLFSRSYCKDAVIGFNSLMFLLGRTLDPILGWREARGTALMPAALSRKVKNYEAELNTIEPEKENLTKQLRLIREASETIAELPEALEELKKAKETIATYKSESIGFRFDIESEYKKSVDLISYIKFKEEAINALMDKCEKVYKVTTTQGLAASFHKRAYRLQLTLLAWVLGLAGALVGGGFLGAHNFKILSETIKTGTANHDFIWVQVILTILSFGSPIWFAWIATKQITKLFKLSEDYSFKSSVAKAYEGFRMEAITFDNDFASRLFDSALTRLEESPLRLMEADEHGSPWHEILSSPKVIKALEASPDLKEKLFNLLNNALTTFNTSKKENVKDDKE